MSGKHTPGPWTVGSGALTARDHAICAGPNIIGEAYGLGYPIGTPARPGGRSPDSEANARLMAAAPRLLGACRMIADYLVTDKSNDWTEELRVIRAAIRAAEGSEG